MASDLIFGAFAGSMQEGGASRSPPHPPAADVFTPAGNVTAQQRFDDLIYAVRNGSSSAVIKGLIEEYEAEVGVKFSESLAAQWLLLDNETLRAIFTACPELEQATCANLYPDQSAIPNGRRDVDFLFAPPQLTSTV